VTAREELIEDHLRQRGEAWCEANGVRFVDINELGVWYDRDGALGVTRGCCPWKDLYRSVFVRGAGPYVIRTFSILAEVNAAAEARLREANAATREKFAYLDDEAEQVRMEDTPQDPYARDEF